MPPDGAAAERFKALCFCYQIQLKKNMKFLEYKMCELTARSNEMLGKLEGGSVQNDVRDWLKKVECIKKTVKTACGTQNSKEQKNCWKGLFPNYHKRQKISKELFILIDEVDKLIMDGATFPLPQATDALPATIVGKTAQEDILYCILNASKRIIGVHGMEGVGKTTIMKNINSRLIKTKHFDCVIWITVSKDVDVNKLQRKVAKELDIDMKEDDDSDGARRKISNALKQRKKFLLVLDNMWGAFNLIEIGIPIPSEENGSQVVLTTRDKQVCEQMQAHAIEVRVLFEEESWEFFKDIVGDVILSKDIKNFAEDVAKECYNLPLAIKTIGESMRGVDNPTVWKAALKYLKEANGAIKGTDRVFVPLKFSYTRLHSHVLRSCLLFCSLYPEEHKISANELIDSWICEGLIDMKGTRQDDIKQGLKMLNKLIEVSWLERCDNHGDAIHVRMHHSIRDMAIKITGAENPRSEIYAGQQLKAFAIEFPEDVTRISLMHNDIKVLSGQPNCQLISTILLQENPLQIIPDSYFNSMCRLRLLNLSSTNMKSLPKSVSNLKNLRALILNCCRDLEEVPSLEKLVELRVLDLSSTKIRELPSGVEAMIYLQRLHLDDTGELRVFPAGVIPKLSHLEELTMYRSRWKWSSNRGEGARIKEILNSPQLTILEIQFNDLSNFLQHAKWKNVTQFIMKRFSLSVCRSLVEILANDKPRVQICGCDLIGEENPLRLPDSTQLLVIFECQISSLRHFTRLLNNSELYCCEISRQNMEYLIADEEPLLPDLKELKMESMPELLALCKGIPSPDALKSLESLHVAYCNKLEYLLPVRLLLQLRCLKSILVEYCPQMKEIVGEEDEMEIPRDGNNNAMLILSQLQSLHISNLPYLKGICSSRLICDALETISIGFCPELKKLPFCAHSRPCALKEIRGEEEWFNALVWEDRKTKDHFESKMRHPSFYAGW